MPWRFDRWTAEHPLPLGASVRVEEGLSVRAGDVIASGTTYGTPVRIAGARRIGVAPDDLERVMRVPLGAEVKRGAIVARTGRRFARAVTAPMDGRVVHRRADGDLHVAPVVGRWAVRATLDGEVTRSTDAVVAVEGSAWALQGVAAYGPDAIGEIALAVDAPVDELQPSRIDVRLRDRILIGGARSTAEAITRAHACGVAAIVAGAVPAAGLRVVYGDEIGAAGARAASDAPTVLCLMGFGVAPLPPEVFLPLVALVGTRAAVHTSSARLFVFAPESAGDFASGTPSLALSDDWLSVRPIAEELTLAGAARFASEVEADAVTTRDGPVPVANVLAFDAPRTPRS
ncbi:MAG TPA: hypothetical protein VGQ86_04335 [Candidatus Limnocylindria bacterium]|jgi:hypothetical protein|nr:hypothetical protein [Candidatus Limnocylindria bacterium]